MKNKLFTDEQEKFILDNYKTMSSTDIAQNLGNNFKQSQISSWLIHHGIKRNGKGCYKTTDIFSKEDEKFIIENYMKMTYTEIGKILGYTAKQINGKVRHLNLPSKKRNINSYYFHNIDNPLKAYFLGFIYADGWVVYNKNASNYEFGMQLQSCDRYVLEKLNQELGNQNIITHSDPKIIMINDKEAHTGHMDCLRVYSKQLVEDLIKQGVETNKSQKNIYPVIQDEFFFDFLRGYIDGDGCYYMDNGQTYMHITSASIDVLIYLKDKLSTYNIETRLYTENKKKHRLMCINKIEMNKLINHLYYEDGLFYLDRKYQRIKHFISSAA